MGTIIILDKAKADELLAYGFRYTEKKSSDNKIMYQFIDTPKLRKVLSRNFSVKDFCVTKTINF